MEREREVFKFLSPAVGNQSISDLDFFKSMTVILHQIV